MNGRTLTVVLVALFITACGSGGDGASPSVSVSLPADASVPDVDRPERTDPPSAIDPALTQPTETAAPVTTVPQAQPPPSTAATETAAANDDGTLWWPWVLGGVVLIAGLVMLIRGRRARPDWQERADVLLSTIDALTNHLAAMTPDGVRSVAAADAQRLATLRAQLVAVVDTAPKHQVAAVQQLTTPLADLHGALDAISLGAGPAGQATESVRLLAARLHTASASTRATLARPA